MTLISFKPIQYLKKKSEICKSNPMKTLKDDEKKFY